MTDDLTSRIVEASASAPHAPAVMSEARGLMHVWCKYCEAWHTHGFSGDRTWRGAHCNIPTPYRKTGYIADFEMGLRLMQEESTKNSVPVTIQSHPSFFDRDSPTKEGK